MARAACSEVNAVEKEHKFLFSGVDLDFKVNHCIRLKNRLRFFKLIDYKNAYPVSGLTASYSPYLTKM